MNASGDNDYLAMRGLSWEVDMYDANTAELPLWKRLRSDGIISASAIVELLEIPVPPVDVFEVARRDRLRPSKQREVRRHMSWR